MNLISRTLTRVVSSSLHHSRAAKLPTRKWLLSRRIRSFTATISSEEIDGGGIEPWAKPPEKKLARPEMIEYKPESSNWVNLIGFVDQPVQFGSCPDGNSWAGTVISQRSGVKSSDFWIPIIFKGDIAKIAARHVKKDDRIHVSGKLFIDSPPPNVTYPQSNAQIMVQNLNFVEATISPPQVKEIITKKKPSRSKKVRVMDEETSNAWKHLLENPKEWVDHRGNKASGLVKPRHPDFKGKEGDLSLWLDSAPDWVLQKLNRLKFDVFVPKGKLKQLKGEESWKDLVENPDKWLDSRSTKTNVKAPDFKHRETGEALWMTDSPTWVLSKLPPLKKTQERPQIVNTTNVKAPDFKHKESGEALWMTASPTWVLLKLPPLKKSQEQPLMAKTVSQPILKQLKSKFSFYQVLCSYVASCYCLVFSKTSFPEMYRRGSLDGLG
ncbi:hypothetical protein EUTSA_v10000889mg [Eutrema salsugineum]|uniref:Uncharacterized protein n=1 Tax=Eutrema salsugineum TaxID=72664 RepID=V4KNW1_EUTSA|nr:hypothetical protein EUTSA_v10000889mg [Eutrema salsugineum]